MCAFVFLARVYRVLQDEPDLPTEARSEMKMYLENMEERMEHSMTHWKDRMHSLESEKLDMNRRLYKMWVSLNSVHYNRFLWLFVFLIYAYGSTVLLSYFFEYFFFNNDTSGWPTVLNELFVYFEVNSGLST